MILLRLFWEFFKTGLFAVGGGMATLPFLYDMAAKTGWFTAANLADLIAAAGLLVLKVAMFHVDAWRESGVLTDLFTWKAVALAAVLIVLTRFVKPLKKLHPILFILGSAVVGVVFAF